MKQEQVPEWKPIKDNNLWSKESSIMGYRKIQCEDA